MNLKNIIKKFGIISLIVVSSTSNSVYAQNTTQVQDATAVQSVQILEPVAFNKYDSVFIEMEKELRTKLKSNSRNIESTILKTNSPEHKIYTKTLTEENSRITLGIVYATSTYSTGYEGNIIFARVSLRSYYEFGNVGTTFIPGVRLKSIEGSLLATYDGAQHIKTEIAAGQANMSDPFNSRQYNFTVTSKTYSRNYSNPYMTDSGSNVGQAATFHFNTPYSGTVKDTAYAQYKG